MPRKLTRAIAGTILHKTIQKAMALPTGYHYVRSGMMRGPLTIDFSGSVRV